MDRPRNLRGTPFTRALLRDLKAFLALAAIVLAVGLAPIVAISIGARWFVEDEPSRASDESPRAGVLPRPEPPPLRPNAISRRRAGHPEAPPATRVVESGEGWIAEDVSYRNAGDRLAGRLFRPTSAGPHPAMVVAHGSGYARRTQYRRWGGALSRAGYALLTYDKRGVGDSEGDYENIGPHNSSRMFDLLAADVIAGVEYLSGREDIDHSRIGVLGISQGGWIGPVAAASSERISFMALVSGPAVSVGEEIYYSRLSRELEGSRRVLSDRELSRQLAGFSGPHGYDPTAVLERLDTPSLWILGRDDRSIPIPETVAELERLRTAGRPVTPVVLRNVGHGMRDLETGERIPVARLVTCWLAGDPAETCFPGA